MAPLSPRQNRPALLRATAQGPGSWTIAFSGVRALLRMGAACGRPCMDREAVQAQAPQGSNGACVCAASRSMRARSAPHAQQPVHSIENEAIEADGASRPICLCSPAISRRLAFGASLRHCRSRSPGSDRINGRASMPHRLPRLFPPAMRGTRRTSNRSRTRCRSVRPDRSTSRARARRGRQDLRAMAACRRR